MLKRICANIVLVGGLFAALFLSGSVSAQVAPQPQSLREQNFDTVISKARQQGAIRVIVALAVDFSPLGVLPSPGPIDLQTSAIRAAQDRVLSQLSGNGVRSVKRFTWIPYLAAEMNPQALTIARRLPDIENISEDRVATTSLAESVPLIGAPRVWAAGFTGTGQVVAVLDQCAKKK